MTNEHTSTEAPREYGELYYSADAVRAILRMVSQYVEANKRSIVSDISSSIPSTVPWHDLSGDVEQSAYFSTICRHVQLRLLYDPVLGTSAVRLDALLRRGPINQRAPDREYLTRLVNKPLDSAR